MIKLKNILSEMEQLRMANPHFDEPPTRPKNRDEWNIDDWSNYWQELKKEVPYVNPKKPRRPRKSPKPQNLSKWDNIRNALKKFLTSK